jgi:hypothetical protein
MRYQTAPRPEVASILACLGRVRTRAACSRWSVRSRAYVAPGTGLNAPTDQRYTKWPSGTPWAVFATYVGGVGSPDTRAPCGRLRHSVHVRVTKNLRGIGREGRYVSISDELSVRPG